jgi:Transmembrane secretion effector
VSAPSRRRLSVSDERQRPVEDDAWESERPGRASLLSRLALDVTPLRGPGAGPFRRLWLGTGISAIGSQVTLVAIPFQVWELTHSTLLVGLLGLAALVPLLTVPLYAGAVADAVDRRRMLLFSDVALLLTTLVLLVNALLPDPRVWLLFVVEASVRPRTASSARPGTRSRRASSHRSS